MRTLTVLCIACFTICAGKTFNFISVKYDLGFNGYWSLSRRVADTEANGFTLADTDKELNVNLYSHKDDPRFFILYDQKGYIAGVRTGYIKEDLPKRGEQNGLSFPYKFEDHKHYESGKYWDTDVWYTSVLFVDPEVLKAGGRQQDPGAVVAEDVFFKLEGKWTKLPKDQCDAEAMGFVKQGCFPGMGMHYFYKTKADMKCKDFAGVFLLYECGKLVGLGMNPLGSFTATSERTWFEDPPVPAVKIIVPNRPQCLTKWVDVYGSTSIHIFFKPVPRLTSCLYPFQKITQCSEIRRKVKSALSGLLLGKSDDTGAQAAEENLPKKTAVSKSTDLE